MNDLTFVNHLNLFFLDVDLRNSSNYTEYMALYNGWVKPGVEYICPRNIKFEFDSPFDTLPTQYPIPPCPTASIDFAEIFDSLGAKVVEKLKQEMQIYLLWSGGIDSTIIATSILKNLNGSKFENFSVVLNATAIEENPYFYNKFLTSFNTVEFDTFCKLNLDFSNTKVLTGEGGDQIFGHSIGNTILAQDPAVAAAPWRQNINVIKHFFDRNQTPGFWELFIDTMTQSISLADANIETVYDFAWWVNYNFKFDSVMLRTPLILFPTLTERNLQMYYKNIMWNLFAETIVQQWSISVGSGQKIGNTKKSFKYAGKKYVHEFDRNEHYFKEKRKEWSLPAKPSPIIALDKNFKIYSFAERDVRKLIYQKFYS